MNVATIVNLLTVVSQVLPGAIATAEQLVDLGARFHATLEGREPTAEEIAALRAAVDADVAIALAPLPPPRPDDPDAGDA